MSGIESALALGGALVSAAGSVVGGIAANNQAKYRAKVAEQQADEARAASQREAIRRAREAKHVLSRQQAVAASSGGGATDPTVLDLMGDVAGEGEYQKGAALYEGNTRGNNFEAQAALDRMAGRQAMFAGFIDAGSTMISGLSSWSKYRAAPAQGLTYG